RGKARIGAHENAELARRHRHGAAAAQRILERDPRLAVPARLKLVERLSARYLENGADLQMVLQIVADAPNVLQHVDPVLLQKLGRAKPRKLQELWRVDGACRQNELA